MSDGLFPGGMDPATLTEISREEVRAAIEALLRIWDRDNARLALALEQLDKAADEIERLRADLNGRDADAERFHAKWTKAEAEIERLRGAGFGGLPYEIAERQRQEIERLREAVAKAAAWFADEGNPAAQQYFLKALEEK